MASMLKDQRILITGAGRGLGRAYALELAARGARIAATDVDEEPLEQLRADDDTGRIRSIVASVAQETDVARTFAEATAALGGLDVVLNNAGVIAATPAGEETETSIRHSVDANLVGALLVGTHAVSHFRDLGRGRLVLTTSNSYLGTPGASTYAATKGAIVSLTYSWAAELAETGIEVCAFAPRAFTRMSKTMGLAAADRRRPEEIAVALAGMLSTPLGTLHGDVISCDGVTLAINSRPRRLPIADLPERELAFQTAHDALIAHRQTGRSGRV